MSAEYTDAYGWIVRASKRASDISEVVNKLQYSTVGALTRRFAALAGPAALTVLVVQAALRAALTRITAVEGLRGEGMRQLIVWQHPSVARLGVTEAEFSQKKGQHANMKSMR